MTSEPFHMSFLSDLIVVAGVYLVMFVAYKIGYRNGCRDHKEERHLN